MSRIWLMGWLLVTGLLLGAAPGLAGEPAPVGPGDLILGKPEAPVTVIEYASMTCPHCARWTSEVFPLFKERFIDTGKVRYVFRDFPLDGVALRASILAHCAGPGPAMGFVDVMYRTQQSWGRAAQPIEDLIKLVRLGGIPEAKARACLEDGSLAQAVARSQADGQQAGVDATPTFFINGTKQSGEIPIEEMAKLVAQAGG